MTSRIRYRDIPKEERKRLARELHHSKPVFSVGLRTVTVLGPVLASQPLIDWIIGKSAPGIFHFCVRISVGLILAGAIWLMVFTPLIRRGIENKKNA